MYPAIVIISSLFILQLCSAFKARASSVQCNWSKPLLCNWQVYYEKWFSYGSSRWCGVGVGYTQARSRNEIRREPKLRKPNYLYGTAVSEPLLSPQAKNYLKVSCKSLWCFAPNLNTFQLLLRMSQGHLCHGKEKQQMTFFFFFFKVHSSTIIMIRSENGCHVELKTG